MHLSSNTSNTSIVLAYYFFAEFFGLAFLDLALFLLFPEHISLHSRHTLQYIVNASRLPSAAFCDPFVSLSFAAFYDPFCSLCFGTHFLKENVLLRHSVTSFILCVLAMCLQHISFGNVSSTYH